MRKIITSVVLLGALTIACSESEFAETKQRPEKPEEAPKAKGKPASVVDDDTDEIATNNPYAPLLKVNEEIDVIGEPNAIVKTPVVTTDTGSTTKPGIESSDGNSQATPPTLEVYFIDPGNQQRNTAILVSNAETFKFGWAATHTTSCKVFVRKTSDPAPGTERAVGGAISGRVEQSRITVGHTFLASCAYKKADGSDATIEKSLDANVDGGWFNAHRAVCPDFCATLGKRNVPSPEGFSCTSGEERPVSAIGVIDFGPTGCWHSCALPEGAAGAVSVSFRCYHPTQKRDNDRTDVTVGCYCKS